MDTRPIIFHHNDMDGRSAAYLVSKELSEPPKFFEIDYDKKSISNYVKNINAETIVYIVDYSFTEPTMKTLLEIISTSKKVFWIDHHESSVELVTKHMSEFQKLVEERNFFAYITKEEGSGVKLVHKLFYPEIETPFWVNLVSDWDTFNHETKNEDYQNLVLCFKYAMESENQNPRSGVWKNLDMEETKTNKPFNDTLTNIIKKGEIIKEATEIGDSKYLKSHGFIAKFENHTCLCMNKMCTSLSFGDYIKEFDFVIAFVYRGKQYNVSIFTKDPNLNVREIAESFGGGGHPKAAGFTCKDLPFTFIQSFSDYLNNHK